MREVRLISDTGEQMGIVLTPKALETAKDLGLDLVEVSPDARPPVCKILDYGKYKYEHEKREKDARKKQHVVVVKEMKIRPKIGIHDLEISSSTPWNFWTKATACAWSSPSAAAKWPTRSWAAKS